MQKCSTTGSWATWPGEPGQVHGMAWHGRIPDEARQNDADNLVRDNSVATTILIGVISILLMLRYRPPPKDAASILYQKFTKKVGIPPSRGETPLSYAVRLAREQAGLAGHADSITVQYLDARYGPHDLLALEKLKVSVSEFSRRS